MYWMNFVAFLLFPVAVVAGQPNQADAKAAAAKAIALIQEVGVHWPEKQSCASCHNQLLPLQAFKRAREHGVPVDEERAAKMLRHSLATFRSDYAIQGWNPEATYENAFTLVAAHDSGVPPNAVAATYARLFARRQMPDGRWLLDDGRPPESFTEITSTALTMRALQLYSSPRMEVETAARVERARGWLEAQKPRETEESAFRLFGLAWAKSNPATLESAVHQLLAEQKPDGGWSQLPRMPSDAYSTGEVLVALHEAGGLPISHQAYRNGVHFLLRSQHADGSWLVNTRIHVPGVSPDYFESGFPYGHSQFISCAATSWAAMALSISLPPVQISHEAATPDPDSVDLPRGGADSRSAASRLIGTHGLKPGAPPTGIMNEQLEPWAETILFGTTEEVRNLLASGLDPNRSTALGTTALMMAAPDPDKARLLLAAGAAPNAKAKSRFTALMVASGYRGNTETVRMLLDRGVEVEPSDPQPIFYISAAYQAAGAGEAETLGLLLDRGANAHRKVIQFWFFPGDTILMPIVLHEDSTLRCLLPHFNKDELNEGLTFAVIDNRGATARDLIQRGAAVNHLDKFGMAALHYAASMDRGDTQMVELLLQSGADTKARTKDGLTALDLAKKYGHADIQRVLERVGDAE